MITAVDQSSELVLFVLAQQDSRQAVVGGMIWLGIYLIVAIVAAWLMTILWRRYLTLDNAGKPDFTLEQLRQLRDQGELTQQQYDRLKEKVIAMTSLHAV